MGQSVSSRPEDGNPLRIWEVERLWCREVADHARRIYEADLSFLLLLSAEGHLLDGFHRLAKAYLLGYTEISVVQFASNPEPDRIRNMPEWLEKTL